MTEQVKLKPMVRTSAGLRDVLFDELEGLRDGTINATKANATAKIAGAIVDTVNMEMAAFKLMQKRTSPDEDHRIPTLSLSS